MINKLIDTAEKLYSGFFLFIGITLAASVTSTYMLTVALFIGVPMSFSGSFYWYHVWIGFDKLWNAIMGGDHKETISSRLGKSVYYDYPPVFWNQNIDRTISWFLSQVDTKHCYKSIDWDVGLNRLRK
jgi:hypothetical protein